MTTGTSRSVVLPSDIKRANRRNVLSALRSGNPMTVATICESTGLSHPTVMKALQEFCEEGRVSSQGLGAATRRGGKKPEMFVFSDRRQLLCVSIWPGTVILSHCSLIGDIEDMETFSLDTDDRFDIVLSHLRALITGYLLSHDLARGDIYGAAFNVPGTVDSEHRLLNYNIKAPHWGTYIPVADLLADLFEPGTALYVDNAGKAVGRALLSERPELMSKRLLTIFTSWGVSACLIDRGHVLGGRKALIGEIGHMIVSDSSPERCVCGKRGCLESRVRPSGVYALLEARGCTVPAGLSFPELFLRSAAGDPHYRAVSEELAHSFAVALHNLSVTYDPEVIVFQGDFAYADEAFDRALRSELAEFAYLGPSEDTVIAYDKRDIRLLAARGDTDHLKAGYFALDARR